MDILLNYDETSMTVDSKSNTTGRKNVKSIDSPSDDDDDDDDNDETEVKNMKAIKEMTEDDFPLPDERIWGKPSSLLLKWSDTTPPVNSNSGIEVTLVTQCSLDRLSNLVKQLYHWGGKASVALYLKPSEWNPDLRGRLIEEITNLRARINKNYGEREFDIALRLVEGYSDGEPYPINYLRNVALLEAREQQLRFNPTLDKSAVLLVDVDFRPSCNLFGMLHSQYAAESAMENRRAIVCPAFEYIKGSTYPYCISNLKKLVDNGQAEGFHLSSFPQGHEPTQFDKFWEKSLQCQDDEKEDQHISNFWQESYEIEHKELFEPYIVMASADVPLYDERFQGYGLNKLSHLASVSKLKSGKFFVLPGVFLVAPTHDRSESWTKIYGKVRSEDTEINQLKLKGLYHNFKKRLRHDQEPIVSKDTQLKQQQLRWKEARKKTVTNILNVPKRRYITVILLLVCARRIPFGVM